MADKRMIYRATRAQIAEQKLMDELRTVYGEDLLALSWNQSERAGQGELEIYLAPGSDTLAAHDVVQRHNPSEALQTQQAHHAKWEKARQNLSQIINNLTDDWSTTPPPDALDKLRSALLDLAYLMRGRPQV